MESWVGVGTEWSIEPIPIKAIHKKAREMASATTLKMAAPGVRFSVGVSCGFPRHDEQSQRPSCSEAHSRQ